MSNRVDGRISCVWIEKYERPKGRSFYVYKKRKGDKMAKHNINENYNGQTKLRHWWTMIRDNLSNLMGWYNSHIDGTADRHRAEDIDYDDSGTVKEKINKIDMSLFKQTNKLPDEILTPGFYYGVGVVNGTLGGSGTYWFAIEIYPVFTNLLQILHQNVNGEWTTYYRNVSGLESDTPQFTEWVRLAKISDVTALRTEVINQIANEVNTRIEADETIRKEIPVKTIENITSETTDNSSYVTPLVVKNAINNLVESSEEIKNIADALVHNAYAVNKLHENLELSLVVPEPTANSVVMTTDSDGKYKFSFTFHNAYIDSNGLFDNGFSSQINNTFEINMLGTIEFGIRYYLYLEWDLMRDKFTMFGTTDNFGTNLDIEYLQFYVGQFTVVDERAVDYYDEQEKSSINIIPMIGNYLSRLDSKCNELQRDMGKKNTAVLFQQIGKSERFSINQSTGDWVVGYSVPKINIIDDTYGNFILPSNIIDIGDTKTKFGTEKKYCYASYTLNTDNLSGEISGSDMTVTYGLKDAKGKPNSYMEIEDETKLTTINIYLGTVILNAENDLLPDGTVSVIYSGSESANENVEINLLKIFNTSGIITGEFVEVTADEVSALF